MTKTRDLADLGGGFIQAGTGAQQRTVESKLQDMVSVLDFIPESEHAAIKAGTSTYDATADIQAALAASQNVKVPKGTYYLSSTVTVPVNYTLETDYGVTFTGPGSITKNGVVVDWGTGGLGPHRFYNERQQIIHSNDSDVNNLFEVSNFRVNAEGNFNGIVGAVVQTGPDNGFPCGITGYGKLNHAGNQVFGLFGRADQYEFGVATNELNTFNYKAGPPGTFPPNRAFGITDAVPVTLTVAAGGTYQSLIGVQITEEGGTPSSYVCGLYSNPGACTDYGVFVDASSTAGPTIPFVGNFTGNLSNNVGLSLQYKSNTPDPNAKHIVCFDDAGSAKFGVKATGQLLFGAGLTESTVGTPGAAAVLPSNPTGYLTVEINGSIKKIPYYES